MSTTNNAPSDDGFMSAIKRNIEKYRLAGNERVAELFEEFLSNRLEDRELRAALKAIAAKDIPEEDQRQQMIEFFPKLEANTEKLSQIVQALELAGA